MKSQTARGSLDILEEAVHLLRIVPLQTLFLYFYGTFPFLLGFLYFWADMSRGPFAYRHVAEAAFGVSILYIWMKCWQSVFCVRIHSHLVGQPPEKFSLRRIFRLLIAQTITQPFGLFALPIAFLILLPFGWTFAFFQNLLVLGTGNDPDIGRPIRTSWRLALLWPAQNHRLLLVLSLFGVVVFLNVGVCLILIPQLLKMLLGIETVFTLSGLHIFNTTYLAIVAALTYLCMDPLIAVVYTLRCFYGESIETGADLLSDLRKVAKAS